MFQFKVFVILLSLDYGLCFINLADVECGVYQARRARIVGGEDSLPSEFPWAASIWRQGAHQCGATVLTDRWLLTAGHCICRFVKRKIDEFTNELLISSLY
ncbi:unnamed protein product [Diatraea saccharalis]|uniref:Peptidase S1 domain-containing protein n=1 Tax=Diatraea saccharalis TaxID=40085 RepID=A0A9N9WDS2_9NEOP|nr:unnamed protein product [Diatraea saccharalis]CAG9788872.1 unnamed protein product [Diatraea saccharalis]